MPFGIKTEGTVLAALLTLFVCSAVLAGTIVPPWQYPDEPTHFALAQLAMPDGGTATARRDVERQVIESMAQYRWWEPYERPTPDPLPATFPSMTFGPGTYAQPLYYGLGVATLQMTNPGGLETAYWHLRVLGVLVGVATLGFGWAGTRLLFGPAVAAGATAIAALRTQFLLTAIAVNPNVLTALWGAFAWWQIGRVVRGRRPELSLVLIVVAAVAAVFTKRSAIPFAAAAILVVVWLFLREGTHGNRSKSLVLATVAIAGAALLGASLVFSGQWAEAVTFWTYPPIANPPVYDGWFPDAIEHVLRSIDEVWLIAGWGRFEAPDPWRFVARFLTLAGMAGGFVLLIQKSVLRQRVLIAWLFVIAQIFVIAALGFWGLLAVPTGRYVEPVLIPMAVLLWLGVERACPGRMRRYAGAALLTTIAIMDVTAFTSVLIPAYLPW